MEGLLAKSWDDYGERRARNYRSLLLLAMDDIASMPHRLGSVPVRRFPGVFVYDISLSRHRQPIGERVRNPWHKLIYRRDSDGITEILAIVGRSYPSGRAARNALIV
jgi:hypothetical protein